MATAAQIATAIENGLAERAMSGGAGVVSVTIDGVSTTYSFDDAVKQLRFWENRAARQSGKRTLFTPINLSGQDD